MPGARVDGSTRTLINCGVSPPAAATSNQSAPALLVAEKATPLTGLDMVSFWGGVTPPPAFAVKLIWLGETEIAGGAASISRMRFPAASVIHKFPFVSNNSPRGIKKLALTASPPSPVFAGSPLPAKVLMIPFGDT